MSSSQNDSSSSNRQSSPSSAAKYEEGSPVSVSAGDAFIRELLPHQPRSLSGIALRSSLLGLCFTASAFACILLAFPARRYPSYQPAASPFWRAPFFLAALSLFHFLEFYTTALANTRLATISAFLLSQNGRAYNIAHISAMAECLVTSVFAPSWQSRRSASCLALGLGLMLLGQSARSAAMLTAGTSFNHTIQTRRAASHTLITSGIYSVLRHPSYFGFFWWAVGTQIAIGNTISLIGYVVVLWNFFHKRVRKEEELLREFFGEDYTIYKRNSWVGIPWVGGQAI